MFGKITRREQEILDAYELWDDEEISTEKLLALVCDECCCEVDEVVETLAKFGVYED